MEINVDEIIEKILEDKKVKYTYPEGFVIRGKLKDRVFIRPPPWEVKEPIIPYFYVADLIEFQKPLQFEAMRFGYYRYTNRLIWASQTTLTDKLSTWKLLLVKAAQEMDWFRNFLRDVCETAGII